MDRDDFRDHIAGPAPAERIIAVAIEHDLNAIRPLCGRREIPRERRIPRVERDRARRSETGHVARRERDVVAVGGVRIDFVCSLVLRGRRLGEDQQSPAGILPKVGGQRHGKARFRHGCAE